MKALTPAIAAAIASIYVAISLPEIFRYTDIISWQVIVFRG